MEIKIVYTQILTISNSIKRQAEGATMSIIKSKLLYVTLTFFLVALPQFASSADMACPAQPTEINFIARNIKSDIAVSAGKLGKITAGEISIKTEVEAKALFDKYPNVDKLFALQLLSFTYCSALNTAGISPVDRLDRWEKFMNRYFILRTNAEKTIPTPKKPAPKKIVPSPPPPKKNRTNFNTRPKTHHFQPIRHRTRINGSRLISNGRNRI